MRETIIIGAGPIGSVLACLLAAQGFEVEVFERTPDPRNNTFTPGRSINLTLCKRGLDVLDAIGAGEQVRALSVPVYGRMIHDCRGVLAYQPYGNRGEAIYSIGRSDLNRVLLMHVARRFNLPVNFGSKCVQINPDEPSVEVKSVHSGMTTTNKAAWVFGADGVHSTVRAGLQRKIRMDVWVRYCKQGYKEMPVPSAGSGWRSDRNVIHIWPRGDYMLIGFPNLDGSFTCSLHLPFDGAVSFEAMQTKEDLHRLFHESFPDAADFLYGFEENVLSTKVNSMITVKCSPWSHAGNVAIVGDAAHSIYPSYGQGANAGFEDCAVLAECIRGHHDRRRAFQEFEARRRPNTDVIADLCADHFEELQTSTGTREFLLKKSIERRLNELYPDAYQDLYSMITFTTVPYRDALRMDREQRTILNSLASLDGIEDKLGTAEVNALIEQLMADRRVSEHRWRSGNGLARM